MVWADGMECLWHRDQRSIVYPMLIFYLPVSKSVKKAARQSNVLFCLTVNNVNNCLLKQSSFAGIGPRCEKTGLRGFRPGPTQTSLYSYRRWLEASNFGFRN